MLAVERRYLQTYGGGFTENFYGLKRERVLRIKGGEAPRARIGAPALMRKTLQLQSNDIWNNLAIMVGLPYLKRKLDESYDTHIPQATILGPSYHRNTVPHDATVRQRILHYYRWFLRNVYPSINAAYYFAILAFNLAYLFDNSKYSSPFLWLIGTRIRRLSEADHQAIALAEQPPVSITPSTGARPGQGSSIFNPTNLTSIVYPRLLSSLKILLPTSIFALKFLEWWHASDFARQLSKKASEGLDLPPPVISGLLSDLPALSGSKKLKTQESPSQHVVTNSVSLSSPLSNSEPTGSPSLHSTNSPKPAKVGPPISSSSLLPIFTVPAPTPATSSLCPICMHPIQTATSAQTGFVFCYTCIFKWVDGSHDRQVTFMEGRSGGEEGWDEDEFDSEDGQTDKTKVEIRRGSKEGKWECGKGRCAVTGRRVLGGTDGLRRVMI